MHRVGRDGISFLDFSNYGIPDASLIILVFGEIDVRCHLLRIRDKTHGDLETLVKRLVYSYYQTLLDNLKRLPNSKFIIRSVVPPVEIPASLEYEFNPYGLLSDRVYTSKLLNQVLRQNAPKYGFYYLDAYTDFCNESGSMNLYFNDGNVHLNENSRSLLTHRLMETLGEIMQDRIVYL
jgi:hypothetical protein